MLVLLMHFFSTMKHTVLYLYSLHELPMITLGIIQSFIQIIMHYFGEKSKNKNVIYLFSWTHYGDASNL